MLIRDTGLHMLGFKDHAFKPQGWSMVVLLEESHVTVHTWPEKASMMVDIMTCGKADPMPFVLRLVSRLTKPQGNSRILIVERGDVPHMEDA